MDALAAPRPVPAFTPNCAKSHPGAGHMQTFYVEIIKPSHHDKDGYVIQWWKAWIPSNSMASLYAISQDCAARKVLGEEVAIEVDAYDEMNIRIPVEKIADRRCRERNSADVRAEPVLPRRGRKGQVPGPSPSRAGARGLTRARLPRLGQTLPSGVPSSASAFPRSSPKADIPISASPLSKTRCVLLSWPGLAGEETGHGTFRV